jgi:V8-like Glu-specific endopeptidase
MILLSSCFDDQAVLITSLTDTTVSEPTLSTTISTIPTTTPELPIVELPVGGDLAGLADGMTRIQITLHDKPIPGEIQSVILDIERVDITQPDGPVLTVFDQAIELDILTVFVDNPFNFGFADIPAGEYEQLRLIVGDGCRLTVDGETYPLRLPSGSQTGLKIIPEYGSWELMEGHLAVFDIDYDPEKQIHVTGNGKYMFKPTIPAVVDIVSEDECCSTMVLEYVTFKDGGIVKMGDRLELEFPPGAVTEDQLISVCPVETPESIIREEREESDYFVGDWFELLPSGNIFNKKVNVKFFDIPNEFFSYPEGAVPGTGAVYLLDEDGNYQKLISHTYYDENGEYILAEIEHFSFTGIGIVGKGRGNVGSKEDDRVPLYENANSNSKRWGNYWKPRNIDNNIPINDYITRYGYTAVHAGKSVGYVRLKALEDSITTYGTAFLVGPNIAITSGHTFDSFFNGHSTNQFCMYADTTNGDRTNRGDCYDIPTDPIIEIGQKEGYFWWNDVDYALFWIENSTFTQTAIKTEGYYGVDKDEKIRHYGSGRNVSPGCPSTTESLDSMPYATCSLPSDIYDWKIADLARSLDENTNLNVIGYPLHPPNDFAGFDYVATLSHPKGAGEPRREKGYYFAHNCDMQQQSSGSPLFDEYFRVVGVGSFAFKASNYAVKLSEIEKESMKNYGASHIFSLERPIFSTVFAGDIFFNESTIGFTFGNVSSSDVRSVEVMARLKHGNSNYGLHSSRIGGAVVLNSPLFTHTVYYIESVPDGDYSVMTRYHDKVVNPPAGISQANAWIVGPWEYYDETVSLLVSYPKFTIDYSAVPDLVEPGSNPIHVPIYVEAPYTYIWKSGKIYVYVKNKDNSETLIEQIPYTKADLGRYDITLGVPVTPNGSRSYIIRTNYLAIPISGDKWGPLSPGKTITIAASDQTDYDFTGAIEILNPTHGYCFTDKGRDGCEVIIETDITKYKDCEEQVQFRFHYGGRSYKYDCDNLTFKYSEWYNVSDAQWLSDKLLLFWNKGSKWAANCPNHWYRVELQIRKWDTSQNNWQVNPQPIHRIHFRVDRTKICQDDDLPEELFWEIPSAEEDSCKSN